MKTKYIAPEICFIECEEEDMLLVTSKPEVIITDVPSNYWTMGAKDNEITLNGYHAWDDMDDEYEISFE